MELPAELQEFLFERVHFDPELAGYSEEREIILAASDLLEFAAAGAEMCALSALVAVPANQRRIRCGHRLRHFWISDKFSPIRLRAQKKWLAGAAANHWYDSPLNSPAGIKSKVRKTKIKEHRQECLCYLRRKGAAAAAVSGGVGILKHETLAHQRFFVFERGAIQIKETFWIDEETRAEFLENFVAVAGLCIEAHGVGQARAAAALYADAQSALFGRNAFLFEEFADLFRGSLAQRDFCDCRIGDFCCHKQMLQGPIEI